MSTIEERVAALESALASMTAAEKRIVELPAASSVANDDFVALDGVANGSRRFAASNLGGKAEVMTEAEWDDLPDSKLTDGKVYALSGVSPSTQDNPLWQKLGFAALDTAADDCSDAINELNTGLTTLNSNLTTYTDIKGNGSGISNVSVKYNAKLKVAYISGTMTGITLATGFTSLVTGFISSSYLPPNDTAISSMCITGGVTAYVSKSGNLCVYSNNAVSNGTLVLGGVISYN